MADVEHDLADEPSGLASLSVSDEVAAATALPSATRNQRGGKKNARGGGGGGAASAGGAASRDVGISKALSKILRHDAEKEGLQLDSEGFANVGELLQWKRLKSLKTTFDDIKSAVSDNSKQRFAMKPNPAIDPLPDSTSVDPSHWLIRANQGHSIKLESAALLTPITLEAENIPDTVVHGTYYAFYAPIVAFGGLKPMGRNHIHFSTGLPEEAGGVISGMRNDAEVLFYIDVRKSLQDKAALWWLSDNGVVLTEGGEAGAVTKEYWSKVIGRRQDVGLLWEEGEEVSKLPQTVSQRKAPSGKGPRGKQREHTDKRRGCGKTGGGPRNKELDILGGEVGIRSDDL